MREQSIAGESNLDGNGTFRREQFNNKTSTRLPRQPVAEGSSGLHQLADQEADDASGYEERQPG